MPDRHSLLCRATSSAGRAQSSYHDFRTYWHERCKVVATRTLCIVLESKLRVCRGSTEKWSDGRTSEVYYEAVISAERSIMDPLTITLIVLIVLAAGGWGYGYA